MPRKPVSLGWGVKKEGKSIWTRNANKGVSVKGERRKRREGGREGGRDGGREMIMRSHAGGFIEIDKSEFYRCFLL